MKAKNLMLYVARFEDGHVIRQDHSDASLTGGANTFSDVLKYMEETSPLVFFELFNHDKSYVMGVDLTDGHFEINGQTFFMEVPRREELRDYRVIYFKRSQLHFGVGLDEPQGAGVGYVLGWQANRLDGSNVQRSIVTAINPTSLS